MFLVDEQRVLDKLGPPSMVVDNHHLVGHVKYFGAFRESGPMGIDNNHKRLIGIMSIASAFFKNTPSYSGSPIVFQQLVYHEIDLFKTM